MLTKRVPDVDADGAEYAARVSVIVSQLEPPITLDDAVNALKEDLSVLSSGYTLIDDARVTTVSGVLAHILGGTFTESSGDLALRDKQIIIVSPRGDATYTISGQALASVWEDKGYNATFDALLTSFEFTDPEGAAPGV